MCFLFANQGIPYKPLQIGTDLIITTCKTLDDKQKNKLDNVGGDD